MENRNDQFQKSIYMKNILSHLLPVRLKKYHSDISGAIEINLINGRRVVDTENSNYSYGSLQKIFSKALHHINYRSLHINEILVLGMGAGSIVDTIRNEFQSNAFLDLVELDETMIEIAKKEFQIDRYNAIHIYQSDAATFVLEATKKYDLILIDLFIIDKVPLVFTQEAFIVQVTTLLAKNGTVIFNTMRKTLPRTTYEQIQKCFRNAGLEVKLFENIYYTNDLIIASVPANK